MAADLNTLAQLKAWGQKMVTQHVDLSHFVYGHEKDLQNACKNERKEGEWLLFMEYVPTKYKDPGGSVSVEFVQPMLIVTTDPNKSNLRDDAIVKANEIFRDIFIRSRRELFLDGNVFSMNDQQVDPIIDSRFGVGAACELDLADFISIDIDQAKWNDGYTGS